jgi:hypothetical protein
MLLFIFSCADIQGDPPPFVISKPKCLIENKPGYFAFAGIEFDFLNKKEKTVSNIYVSFILYDADTKTNPLIGSNIIKMSFDGMVKSKERQKFFISLDSYVYTIPDKAYLIDFFYIAKIVYEDGSQWEDTNGIYFAKSY